jgi:serine/threonine-protein kinase
VEDTRIGPYRLLETLGQGTFSTVEKAVQEPLGRTVALKVLKSQIAVASTFADQLVAEGAVLRELAHPNVVFLLDAGRSPTGRPYLALECIDGISLAQLLAKKQVLQRTTALSIAVGIASALAHVHERGYVHCDVKPSNVLLTKSGNVKLIDFGIAQRTNDTRTSASSVEAAPKTDTFGTPAYMSPEQVLGSAVDGRSDLYSLGVLLYQMLYGHRPVDPQTRSAGAREKSVLVRKNARSGNDEEDARAALATRAPHLDRIVTRLLQKSPHARYANAVEVVERLQTALRAETHRDPTVWVRAAMGEPIDGDADTPRARSRTSRVVAGQVLVGIVFLLGVVAIEAGRGPHMQGHTLGPRTLELVPEKAGGLRVLASPWAHVLIDGRHVETTPFARAIPLAAGTYWVTLTHPDAPSVERQVTIVHNETLTLDVSMPIVHLE